MNYNWDALTAISTFFLTLFTLGLMLATIWLAIIALQAKNTWKDEHKEKKRLDLIRLTKNLLVNLSSHLCIAKHISCNGDEYDYLVKLHRLSEQLLNLQDELMCINCAIFSGTLIEIITKGNNCPIFQSAIAGNVNFDIDSNYAIISEFKALLKNQDELLNLINKSIEICDVEIQKFYNS